MDQIAEADKNTVIQKFFKAFGEFVLYLAATVGTGAAVALGAWLFCTAFGIGIPVIML